MKSLWQKKPAWLKAILLNLILLFPILIINQVIVQLNLRFYPKYGIGLIFIFITLFMYWKAINKWNPFNDKNDIKMDLKFQLLKTENILSILGICLLSAVLLALSLYIFEIDSSRQYVLIKSFSNYNAQTAIPLLFGLALTAGIIEEVTYRGYMQNTTNRAYSKFISYLIIAIIFTTFHFLPLELIVPYLLMSFAYSYVADKQKSIGLVIFTHTFFDFVVFMMIYFNVI